MKLLKCNKLFLIFLFLAIALAAGLWSSRLLDTPSKAEASIPEYSTRLFEPPIPLNAFSLKDHNGRTYNPIKMMGYWTFVFFGYTNCPDVCPMALVDLNELYSDLESGYELGNTKVAFVSVDPERDDPDYLGEYVTYFNENFIGLTGDAGQVAGFSDQFGAVYKKVFEEGEPVEDYLVDHTASIMLVDHLGQLIAVFPPPHNTKHIKAEFLKLRDKYGDGYGCLVE
jgi:protein SCO1/2